MWIIFLPVESEEHIIQNMDHHDAKETGVSYDGVTLCPENLPLWRLIRNEKSHVDPVLSCL